MKIEEILKFDYSLYCFDFFDTIVRRTVEPEYVKKIWAKEISNILYVENINTLEIYEKRAALEKELCKKNEEQGKALEFKYKDMVCGLYNILDISQMSFEKFYELAYELEVEIELRVEELCDDVVGILRELKSKGKNIICITDFYMPKVFFDTLLKYHGLEHLFSEIFVSSEYLYTKNSGGLYSIMLNAMHIAPQKILMIGDNPYSDIESAKQFGINTYFVDRAAQKDLYKKYESTHNKNSIIRDMLKIYKKCSRSDYEDMAFSLYLFIEKLYYRCLAESKKDIFFLSREGEFLKKLFDFYQEQHGGEHQINTHYLMVSRKSTFMASLKPLKDEKFQVIFRQYIHISLSDFLSSLGFSDKEQKQIAEELHVDIYQKVEDFPRSEVYSLLLNSSTFEDMYESKRKEQHDNFLKYLMDFKVDFYRDGLSIVDVGWKGTIQDNIYSFFGGSVLIEGYYLGLVADSMPAKKNKKFGIVFNVFPKESKFYQVYFSNTAIFEVILGASHGSADQYVINGENICVITSEKQEERELFIKIVDPIQRKIFSVFRKIYFSLINSVYSLSELEDLTADIHARLVFSPTKEQMNIFYNIYHYENFGVFEFTKFKNSIRNTILDRLRNLWKLYIEKEKFFNGTFWKVLSLKDAGLSLLIRPYGRYMYRKYYIREKENMQ